MALAPLRIDGPLPTAPPFGLVTTPGTIAEEPDSHWMAGVALEAYTDDLPANHDPCSTGSGRMKDEGSPPPMPEFSSFTVYYPMTCSGIGLGSEAGAERLRNRALRVLNAVETYGVEREFAFGDASTAKPYLADGNDTKVAGGAAVSPREALSLLEQEIGKTARNGLIHLDPATFVAMDAMALFHDEGAVKKTNRGNTVIIGNGYIGLSPEGQAAPTGDNGWAFATGPVRILRSEVTVLGPTAQSLNRDNNDVTFRAERTYVAYWDTSLQAAALVDRSANP